MPRGSDGDGNHDANVDMVRIEPGDEHNPCKWFIYIDGDPVAVAAVTIDRGEYRVQDRDTGNVTFTETVKQAAQKYGKVT